MKYEDLLESASGLAQQLTALNEQAFSVYRPRVEDLIRTDSRDQAAIEQTLDGLLGFCGHDGALMLYRRLCRHFWQYNPEATAGYRIRNRYCHSQTGRWSTSLSATAKSA